MKLFSSGCLMKGHFSEFSTSNIQIDKDFTAKLSGYGCVGFNSEEIPKTSVSAANLSVETLEKGLLTPESNVWSFGIVLLELITGRKNLDVSSSKEERYPLQEPGSKGSMPISSARAICRTKASYRNHKTENKWMMNSKKAVC